MSSSSGHQSFFDVVRNVVKTSNPQLYRKLSKSDEPRTSTALEFTSGYDTRNYDESHSRDRKRMSIIQSVLLVVILAITLVATFLPHWFIYAGTIQSPDTSNQPRPFQENVGLYQTCYYNYLQENAWECSPFLSFSWKLCNDYGPTANDTDPNVAFLKASAEASCKGLKATGGLAITSASLALLALTGTIYNIIGKSRIRLVYSLSFWLANLSFLCQLTAFFVGYKANWDLQYDGGFTGTVASLGASFFMWLVNMMLSFFLLMFMGFVWPRLDA
ncbi:uncharacterized protein BJ171DRAFT_505517 [Polychytrium aggregatum]|uniref:uncharacterized protein n=1 Tax=Polychytrium aggregatum TaxID=110093 RepID=UPI0022FDF940|nr:uncharacterized protein BJ171DRAFT_505517 [Polychytrium aggregatum]KAI9204333.1 hypothetical protein BJ171DRAFT_505517 [Polychytrium aggregatum]